jgi:hypothetical protein
MLLQSRQVIDSIARLDFRDGQFAEIAGDIFEEHLDGWYRVPAVWPTERDLTTFQRWFECSFHSMIVDLHDDVLEHEKM